MSTLKHEMIYICATSLNFTLRLNNLDKFYTISSCTLPAATEFYDTINKIKFSYDISFREIVQSSIFFFKKKLITPRLKHMADFTIQ